MLWISRVRMFARKLCVGHGECLHVANQVTLPLRVELVCNGAGHVAHAHTALEQPQTQFQVLPHPQALIESARCRKHLARQRRITEHAVCYLDGRIGFSPLPQRKHANFPLEALGRQARRTVRTQENCAERNGLHHLAVESQVLRDQIPVAEHVIVEEEHKITLGGTKPGVARARQPPVFLLDNAQLARRLHRSNRLRRAIRRSIDNNNHLPRRGWNTLGEECLQRPAYNLPPVVRGDNDGNLHAILFALVTLRRRARPAHRILFALFDKSYTIDAHAPHPVGSPRPRGSQRGLAATAGRASVAPEGGLSDLKHLMPAPMRAWLRHRRGAAQKALIHLDRVTDWSVLRRTRPYRADFGVQRGSCIDRFYIEQFLALHAEDIRGHVAEMESAQYTRQFGAGQVEQSDVLDINPLNQERTLTLDLEQTESAPAARFDCIICTQTIFLIRDCRAAIRTLHRMLKPCGVLLATMPGISPIVPPHLAAGMGEDWWRFTRRSAQSGFENTFGSGQVVAQACGNVLAATAFLHGLVQEELTRDELEYHDPSFELIIAVRAVKAAN